MKKKIFSLCFSLLVLLSIPTFAQGPGEPYNPMTAPGARGITWVNNQYFAHKLIWKNPASTVYNKIYFSENFDLVNSLDSSALLYNGYPSTVYINISLSTVGNLDHSKRYYWKVVEYNSVASTIGPTWFFISQISSGFMFDEDFENGFTDWQIIGPSGIYNWSIAYSSNAGGNEPELSFSWSPSFIGNSYIMYNQEFDGFLYYTFNHFVDWYANPFTVGFGVTTDSGNSWTSIWEISPTGNTGPIMINGLLNGILNEYRIGFYFVGDSYNIDFWYLDDITVGTTLTPPDPPAYLEAMADSTQLRVLLNWNSGWCISNQPSGYEIKRKNGLPTDTSSYYLLTTINNNTLFFVDENVLPNKVYTYRIRTLCESIRTIWGNEATAYVPNIVPVELQSFTSEVIGSDVKLLWSTATETNNQGFEILRSAQNDINSWENIGFVPGFGTTTEVHHYSFVDEAIQPGNYQYRLKQIDFDGTFEYSNIIEVTIDAPTIFSLEQNYPNPFNPTTKIKFQIPLSPPLLKGESEAGGFVTLKVFDVLGNEVAILVNEQKPAGTYEVEFIGTELPSGVYFYQLKAGEYVSTKKMLLLR